MKLRSRLDLAFAYILLAVIVALTIPLAINLSRRAKAELGADTLITAQTLAAYVGRENINDPAVLADLLQTATPSQIKRVVVTDMSGAIIYDSAGDPVGTIFVNSERPEMTSALGGNPFYEVRYSQTEGATIMVAAAPIIDEQQVGVIRLTRDYTEVADAVRTSTIGVLGIGLAGVVAGVLIAFGLAGSIVQPIQTLATTTHKLGSGDLTARAGDVGGGAEVKELAAMFDQMAERLERTVSAQREFVANASHQLRTPLTGMKLRLEAAIADAPGETLRHGLQAADREVDRLSEIVDRLMVMAREIEQGAPTHVDLGEAVHRAVERWAPRAEQLGSTITASGPGGVAQANPADLDQILDNLLDNAIAYAPGAIELETGAQERRVWLAVRDHGRGIPPEEQNRVVERFYRGKGAPAGGSGLGLAIARELAEKWGGSLTVTGPQDGGTRIVIGFRGLRTGTHD